MGTTWPEGMPWCGAGNEPVSLSHIWGQGFWIVAVTNPAGVHTEGQAMSCADAVRHVCFPLLTWAVSLSWEGSREEVSPGWAVGGRIG